MSRRDRRATRVDARSRPGRLAEQPPRGIGDHRAKVVVMVMVIELIGAPAVDATVARSPGADGRRVTPARRERHHHLSGPQDRPNAGDPWVDRRSIRTIGDRQGRLDGASDRSVYSDHKGRWQHLVSPGPALVSIVRHRSYLVASVHTALDDTEMIRFRDDLVDEAGAPWCTGVVIDVAALDVLDSFGFTTIRSIAGMARLRGALTVIVGIQPDVALATARLGVGTGSVATAADLEEGLASLDRSHPRASPPPR